MDRRRLIYGDWNWLVRDGLDVLRLLFISGTVVFAILGRPDAAALTAASAVLLVARIINLPRWFDFGLGVAMTLIAWGTALHLYGQWFYYDKVVHSLSPMAYAPVLYIALVRLGVVPDPGVAIREHRVPRIVGIFIVTLAVGMAVGAGYETVEWFEDKFDILGGHFVKGLWDTETDLLADETGSLVGATFITVWALHGWSSRRVTVVPAPPPSESAAARLAPQIESLATSWHARLAALPPVSQGLVALAAGTILLAWPSPTVRAVGIVLGLALVVHAALEIVDLWRRRARPGLGSGAEIVASVAAGVLLLVWPGISQLALLYVAGASAIALAVVSAATIATEGRTTRDRWVGGALSIVGLIFGVALLGSPDRSFDAVLTLLGVYLLVVGVLRLVRAYAASPRGRRRRTSQRTPSERAATAKAIPSASSSPFQGEFSNARPPK
jgi:uncharacterized membrane protein HdeD (DUF308 family)/uncharacterized membrane protein YjdF